ncbi:MAG: transporter substrate-binding domain-containing protein [Acidobacteriota bacterium]
MCSLVLLALLSGGGCSPVGERGQASERVWRVGVERQLPPFAFVERGEIRGLAVDLTAAIAQTYGYEIEWVTGETGDLREALAAGEIDLIPHMPVSTQLEQRFALSLPHTDLDDGLFVRDDDDSWGVPDNLSLEDLLLNRRVLVLAGDQSEELATSRAARALTRSSPSAALRSLAAGEGDCAILPKRIAQPLIESLGLSNLQQLPGRIVNYSRPLAFAVRADNEALLEELEQGLVIATRSRQYLTIYNRWERWRQETLWTRVLLWALAPLLLMSMWAWSLRRTVAARTAELQTEMAQRRQLEQRMQESQKMESLGVLAGGIAHDFNNLLVGVLGNASLAQRFVARDSVVYQRLEEIRVTGRRASELCQQMLAYSGKGRFVIERVELNALVRDSEERLDATLGAGVRLELKLSREAPAVSADVGQLHQVLTRLVENAAEALGEGEGTITLETGSRRCEESELLELYPGDSLPAGLYALLTVRDDGLGMDEQTRERAFEPFFSTKFTGRGLGLAATLGIVRGHRGAIDLHSVPGEGTRFTVYLPAWSEGEESGSRDPDSGPGL